MESGDGVELDGGYGVAAKVVVEGNGVGLLVNNENEENEVSENGADVAAAQANSASEDTSKSEVIDSSPVVDEASTVVVEKKPSGVAKKSGTDVGSRSKKAVKAGVGARGAAVGADSIKKKPVLSQSATFPSKGFGGNSLRKSAVLEKPAKVVSSSGDSVKPAKPASAASSRRTLNAKTGSSDATENSTSDIAESNGGNAKVLRHSLPAKIDDDAHSTTSSTTPRARRSTGSGFCFKLDERAEKRKEFFMKLEEKTHAKELEKTNLQAKSMESQEAEIKQLRKSLNFKATPMPNFYKEAGPPKVELKKIPPTRPISPKLGRRKSTVATTDNASDVGISCEGPQLSAGSKKQIESKVNNKENQVASKNVMRKTLARVPSQKTKAKQEAPKAKIPNKKAQTEQAKVEIEDKNQTEVVSETCDLAEAAHPENKIEEGYTVLSHADAEILSQEISV